ncbi:MAG: amidase [Chloroflexi bacterium]|nr:amidase [Chloroflexota bacterium]
MPTIDENLAFTPASELAALIADKQVSPVELTQLYFDRIDRLDSQLNSYLTLTQDEAMQAARDAESAVMRGDALGALHGVPISIKDLELTKGIRTTSGCFVFKDRIPDEDSIVVERVKASGAIILGKTNTPEFGHRGTTENLLGEPCRNPWNTERTPGGSSGGAAAGLAAGLCAISTGSDGGGSVRIPASFCGLYGIKPTQGRVPRYGGRSTPAIANQLSQSGPITRTVRDSAILLQALAGRDARDARSLRDTPGDYIAALDRDISGLRIGWSSDFGYAAVDPEVMDVCGKAAQVFGELECEVSDSGFTIDSPQEAFRVLFAVNTYASSGYLLHEHGGDLTDYFRANMEFAATQTAADYARAIGELDIVKARFDEYFENYDLLLSPTMAVPAFEIEQHPTSVAGQEVDPFFGYLPFTYPVNAIGHPAASVPCGFSSDGMPIGLHIVGRHGDEETVLAASAAFERVMPWVHKMPPVS